MTRYILRVLDSAEHRLGIILETRVSEGITNFNLPIWRPGRYEHQEYFRHISDVKAEDETGNELFCNRTGTNTWEVIVPAATLLRLSYSYFAGTIDAGSSFADEDLLYVNGVNLFLYQKEHINGPCTLEIIPGLQQYAIAGLVKTQHATYSFDSYHHLVDTPFMVSPTLLQHQIEVNGVQLHIGFYGRETLPMREISEHISRILASQYKLFGDIPTKEYHLIGILVPNRFRHGVEHAQSTVLVMGPSQELESDDLYASFLELCSHEIFHIWNVKAFRPAEYVPYRYDVAVFSGLHYVTEGITTYYGDLMLWKAGLISFEGWVARLNELLSDFYLSGGKDHISLYQSSLDSWVNGYLKVVDYGRKISFYVKGALFSFLLDAMLRMHSDHAWNLDVFMRKLYQLKGKGTMGYTQAEIVSLLSEFGDYPVEDFLRRFLFGTDPLETSLLLAGTYLGLHLSMVPVALKWKIYWGFQWEINAKGETLISRVASDSPANRAGISPGDQLIAYNGKKIVQNLTQFVEGTMPHTTVTLQIFRRDQLKTVQLSIEDLNDRLVPQFTPERPDPMQELNRLRWQEIS